MDNNNEFSYNNTPANGTNDNSGSQAETAYTAPEANSYGTQENAYGTQSNTYSSQNMNGTQTNAYGTQQSSPYQQTSPYQSPYGNAYQNPYGNQNNQNAYRQAMGQPQQTQAQAPKPKKEKKSGGFGATLGKCAAIAVIFGLVAGGIFTGISYAGTKALGISATTSADASAGTTDSGSDKKNSDSAEKSTQQTSANVESTATGTAKDLQSVSDIVEEVMPGIVAITNTSVVSYQSFFGGVQQYESESCGSGIIIQEDSDYLYIATNNHVVSGAETLSVQFVDGNSVDGEIQGTYAASDLAVVKVALKDIDSDTLSQIRLVTIGDSDSLKVGEGTIAIGNALGYGQSVTTGCVSALGRSITVSDDSTGTTTTCNNLIQTDAAINPGNSGGALLDGSGALIGINSAKYADTDVEGIGYAIPINDAMKIIKALIAGDSLEQTAYLGIGGGDVSSDVASAYGLPQGVYVKTVYEGSGAADAGICQGDIITGIDGTEISSMTELQTLLIGYSAGDTVTLTVWRMNNGYQSMEVEVTLSDASVLGDDATTSGGSDNSDSSNGGSSDDSNGYGNGYGGNDNGFGDFNFGFGW
jgi:serine protease Do